MNFIRISFASFIIFIGLLSGIFYLTKSAKTPYILKSIKTEKIAPPPTATTTPFLKPVEREDLKKLLEEILE